MVHVVIVQQRIPDYRIEFFEGLRRAFEESGDRVTVVYSRASKEGRSKRDEAVLPWATPVRSFSIRLGGIEISFQNTIRYLFSADIVVVEQANRHMATYLSVLLRLLLGRPRILWWGHGADLQYQGKCLAGLRASWKRSLTAFGDGALAYTAGSAVRFASCGLGAEKISVLNNTTDIAWARDIDAISAHHHKTVAYLGSLYSEKRLDILFQAIDIVAQTLEGFRCLVIGDGPQREWVEQAVSTRPFVRLHQRADGESKRSLLGQSALIVNPGMVGLVAIDSFASGRPIVTLRQSAHSPEFEYLEHEVNSSIISGSSSEFAAEVLRLLTSEEALTELSRGARASMGAYSLDSMIRAFHGGVIAEKAAVKDRSIDRRWLFRDCGYQVDRRK